MTVFSPGPFVRRAALAAATVFAAPVYAQEQTAPASAAPIVDMEPESMYKNVFRDLFIRIGHDLQQPESASLKKNIVELQETLNLYGERRMGLSFPVLQTDGVLGEDTAEAALKIIQEEKIYEALIVPRDTELSVEDGGALKTFADRLAVLQPTLFAEGLRDIVRMVADDNKNNIKAGIAGMRLAFRYCAALDQRAFASKLIESEINAVSTREGYISRVVPERCARMLYSLPPDMREAAQTEYLKARPRTDRPGQAAWCLVRDRSACHLLEL